jgi:hypothetical protein
LLRLRLFRYNSTTLEEATGSLFILSLIFIIKLLPDIKFTKIHINIPAKALAITNANISGLIEAGKGHNPFRRIVNKQSFKKFYIHPGIELSGWQFFYKNSQLAA